MSTILSRGAQIDALIAAGYAPEALYPFLVGYVARHVPDDVWAGAIAAAHKDLAEELAEANP